TCLERIDELGHILATTPPRMLRNGSLGVRDLRRIATELDTDTNTTTLYLEIAYSAGLIGTYDPPARHADTDTYYAPTLTYDAWRHTSAATRWARLALAWFDTDRTTTATTPLGPENTSTAYRTTRHSVLHALTCLPTGHGTTPASLATSLTTQHPRRDPNLLTDATHITLHEGTHLGIITNGALTPTGHALWIAWNNGLTTTDLIDPDTPPSAEDDPHSTALHALATLDTHLPPPANDILLQSDLTAVVPGRLEGHTADLLRLIADLESRGGASVFRFTPESIRRYLDTAASADDLLTTLKRHCPTGIPQPLEYLIRDVARRHGRVRVGETSTYLTSDDTSCLDAIEHDPRLTHLALRRLAPTVVITHYDRNTTLTALRKAGHSPLAESFSGNHIPHSRNTIRATDQHTPTPILTAPPPISHDDAAHLIQAMRAGDAALTNNDDPTIEASDPTITLDTLREAITARHNVWIALAGPDGSTTKLLLRPTFIEAGRVHGIVDGSDAVRTFSIHRLIGATTAPANPLNS
ncbi:helicase-associated domain-containing protein, partial [Dermatophilus congolensis]